MPGHKDWLAGAGGFEPPYGRIKAAGMDGVRLHETGAPAIAGAAGGLSLPPRPAAVGNGEGEGIRVPDPKLWQGCAPYAALRVIRSTVVSAGAGIDIGSGLANQPGPQGPASCYTSRELPPDLHTAG